MTDQAFRQQVRQFIARHLPPEIATRTLAAYHPHKPDVLYWTRTLNECGWSVPHWPREYGGPGWTITQQLIFDEECFLAGCPALSPQGLHLVGPIIYTYGSEAQKARFLPAIRSGEHLWAQGFSEPNAGSDLAALQTRAIRQGDDYVVNGQKIWTSDAHDSEWVFLLVRTSSTGKPQEGISFLLAELSSPGLTVRPIVSLDGGHVLNEVFLQDVRIPVSQRVGEENRGWTYAKQLLGAERTFTSEVPRCKGMLARLRQLARDGRVQERSLLDDPAFAKRMAQLEIDVLAHETTLWRVVAEQETGASNATASILKVKGSELIQRIGELMVEALGDAALPRYLQSDHLPGVGTKTPLNPAAPGVVADFLYRRSMTIYGGTNEVQRNLVAAELLRGP
jgi:alkylation response protein AidB-like acyl-CoA dehydrogenase